MDNEKQRQSRRADARLTASGNARSEQLLVVPSAYRVTNQQGMATRRALEWIGASKPGWFLDMKYQTCFFKFKRISSNVLRSHIKMTLERTASHNKVTCFPLLIPRCQLGKV